MAETEIPSEVPFSVLFFEGAAALAVLIVMVFLFVRAYNRKKIAALTLAVAFGFWGLGALAVVIFAILQYVYRQPVNNMDLIQFAPWGINLGYAFSALSNVFMVLFVSQIFSQAQFFRRTKKALPLINGILNGITIGLVTTTLSDDYINPQYPIPQTVYHLVLTFLAFGLLIGFSFNARKDAILKWEKAGFSFIITSGFFGIAIYLSFALDIIVADFIPAIFEGGYTFFNYLGWVFAVLMCLFAYAGYAMPEGLRRWFIEEAK